MKSLSFLTESAGSNFQETATIGSFSLGSQKNNFDDIFETSSQIFEGAELNLMQDINQFIKSDALMESYKESLIGELMRECSELSEDEDKAFGGTHANRYAMISDMFDNCRADLIKEAANVGTLLPIKAIDFPVLVKQALKLASSDVLQSETTRSPIVKKHLEQTWIVDNNDKTKKWKYPQCFFDASYKEARAAGEGYPIKNTGVAIPAGGLNDYNIITNLTDVPTAARDRHSVAMGLQIVAVDVTVKTGDVQKYVFPRPVTANISDGMFLGGVVSHEFTPADGSTKVAVNGKLFGSLDYATGTVTIAVTDSKITKVYFNGFVSNETNERNVGFEFTREERVWEIKDGVRANCSFSLEDLEDHKALLDMDLYKKTYNVLGDFLVQLEDSDVFDFLDKEFDKYKGVEVNPLDFDPFIYQTSFDCDSTSVTTALPVEFIEKMLKFTIDGMIADIADGAKLEDITFVAYGNPRLIRLLDAKVNWVTRPGSTSNGVKLDYGYGIMTSGDVKVQVVSTKKVNAKYDTSSRKYKGIRLIPYPLNKEQMTFKHFKYTSHIVTNNNSAYRDQNLPGGSMTNLMGTSRYINAAVQGIQGEVTIANAAKYIQPTYMGDKTL